MTSAEYINYNMLANFVSEQCIAIDYKQYDIVTTE